MNKHGIQIAFLILLLASIVPVIADSEHDYETKTLDGCEIGLLMEPENPKVGEEAHLMAHIENESESVSALHVEIQITKMEMHAGEMEEHTVLDFEEGHAHEEETEPGYYAHHYTFEEEGTYMIRVKIEDVGVTDAFHITVEGSFHKGELTMPLAFTAIGIGIATLMIIWTKKSGA
ncbi:MAG: hypothetical protein ACE5J5_07680 [Candidatus Hydrothermarchaeales archaeon]